ncbi:MAG: DNA-primase RepB domain-containing protein [Rudaea sp.]|nr:DNA-primase RepB domain-containing protein [Rudaea sp.]
MNTEAEQFLRVLGSRFTFQTFDDSPRKDRRLSCVLHGTLAEHAGTIAGLNARGAGVFVMVNEGDGKGRSICNVQRVRAYFADLDGARLAPVQVAPLRPHCIIETSTGHWHAYWLLIDAPLESFKATQQAIAARFGSDPKVCDLPRVMRLPGFLHCKGDPFQTSIVELHDAPHYSHVEFVEAFAISSIVKRRAPVQADAGHANVTSSTCATRHKRALPAMISEGERNATLFELACGLVRQGFDAQAVNDRLQRINAERCQPPLCASEVGTIATRAVAYGSEGFTLLLHSLLDSPEWKALPPPAHEIVLIWFRRYNGYNQENIALTWADFEGLPGFANKQTFYRHRSRAIASGILQCVTESGNSRNGRKPDLFTIAPQWLRNGPVSKLKPCASVENVHPYIDKQSLADLVDSPTSNRKRSAR